MRRTVSITLSVSSHDEDDDEEEKQSFFFFFFFLKRPLHEVVVSPVVQPDREESVKHVSGTVHVSVEVEHDDDDDEEEQDDDDDDKVSHDDESKNDVSKDEQDLNPSLSHESRPQRHGSHPHVLHTPQRRPRQTHFSFLHTEHQPSLRWPWRRRHMHSLRLHTEHQPSL